MKRDLLLPAFLLVLLAGCSPWTSSASSPIPTPYPPEYLPTVIALTARAANAASTETAIASIPTVVPTDTPEPTATSTASRTPTPRPTFTSTSIPGHDRAAIQIFSPGPMSKVVSPILLRMNVISGESEKIQVDLYGEDGRLLSRIQKKVPHYRDGSFQSIRIPFEIRAAAELGRITVSTEDNAGRVQSLNSVRVLMLSSGSNEITPSGSPYEAVGVYSPPAAEPIFGGVLNVRGDVWPLNLQPIILELLGPDGKSISLRILTVENLTPQLFETTIPYKVGDPTAARLSIRQEDDRIPGLFYVYTQEVLLNP